MFCTSPVRRCRRQPARQPAIHEPRARMQAGMQACGGPTSPAVDPLLLVAARQQRHRRRQAGLLRLEAVLLVRAQHGSRGEAARLVAPVGGRWRVWVSWAGGRCTCGGGRGRGGRQRRQRTGPGQSHQACSTAAGRGSLGTALGGELDPHRGKAVLAAVALPPALGHLRGGRSAWRQGAVSWRRRQVGPAGRRRAGQPARAGAGTPQPARCRRRASGAPPHAARRRGALRTRGAAAPRCIRRPCSGRPARVVGGWVGEVVVASVAWRDGPAVAVAAAALAQQHARPSPLPSPAHLHRQLGDCVHFGGHLVLGLQSGHHLHSDVCVGDSVHASVGCARSLLWLAITHQDTHPDHTPSPPTLSSRSCSSSSTKSLYLQVGRGWR